MEAFIIELISNATAQLFPVIAISTFTKFLPEQLKVEIPWEIANSEVSKPSRYQNITDGKFMSFDQKLSKSSKIFLEPPLHPSIRILLKP